MGRTCVNLIGNCLATHWQNKAGVSLTSRCKGSVLRMERIAASPILELVSKIDGNSTFAHNPEWKQKGSELIIDTSGAANAVQ